MSVSVESALSPLLLFCARNAKELPSHANLPSAEVEREVDELCRTLATGKLQKRSLRRLAGPLIPRLQFARVFGSVVQHDFELRARAEEVEVDEVALLEYLLIDLWHQQGKALWLSDDWNKLDS